MLHSLLQRGFWNTKRNYDLCKVEYFVIYYSTLDVRYSGFVQRIMNIEH